MPNKTVIVQLAKNASEREEKITSDLIKKAYQLAEKKLDPNTERGEKGLEHAVRVAKTLFDLGFDSTTIAAGIVHHLETNGAADQEITRQLGKETESITSDFLKIGKIEERNAEKLKPENLSTIILSTAKDLRALLIKLVARLETLEYGLGLSKKELAKKAQSALQIYAPICQKLGLYELQSMLEDSSMKIMQPSQFQEIEKKLGKTRDRRNAEVESAISEFSTAIGEKSGQVSIQGRAKSVYSIYQKMHEQNRPFEEIFDLVGLRMICNSVRECYELLGIIHSEYKTVPNQFSDHIANPKKNGYRSIHTAVQWKGQPLEIQIRTWEMHYECETGLASHWQYKQYARDKFFDKRLSWAKQLMEWNRSAKSFADISHSLKMDFGKNQIFVFTPKQDVIVLPEASTPIDFAFAIHSELGHKSLKAKVNGKITHLSHGLENADTVEIITGKETRTKRQWLSFVKSHKAQAKIRQKLGIKPPKKRQVLARAQKTLTSDKNVRVAKCCNPLPGDEILGVKTTKRKISVHKKGCGNTNKIPPSRKIEVQWGLAEKDYTIGIKVKARDNPGLLPAILNIISNNRATISSTDAKTGRGNILQSKFNIKIKSAEQLENIMGRIEALPLVLRVERE